ncbi:MAG TPA: hypothetical protein GXZ43_03865 [Clostridiaceae bacterium]|nr:hypothetical protein [Clostridiaceae bacterium]
MDTVGGCLALCGMKPQDNSFWEAAAFIDINGPHHLPKISQKLQDQLNAYFAWEKNQSWPHFLKITDVTMLVKNASIILQEIINYNPNIQDPDSISQKLIQCGQKWYSEIRVKVEKALVYENEHFRVFKPSTDIFTASSYYSSKFNRIVKATITYNTNTEVLTLAFEDGGKTIFC